TEVPAPPRAAHRRARRPSTHALRRQSLQMSGVNPQGVQVFSFKHPSATELEHDFLWREVACLPERGRIGIFNRSYYEEVLVVKFFLHLSKRAQKRRCLTRIDAPHKNWQSSG